MLACLIYSENSVLSCSVTSPTGYCICSISAEKSVNASVNPNRDWPPFFMLFMKKCFYINIIYSAGFSYARAVGGVRIETVLLLPVQNIRLCAFQALLWLARFLLL